MKDKLLLIAFGIAIATTAQFITNNLGFNFISKAEANNNFCSFMVANDWYGENGVESMINRARAGGYRRVVSISGLYRGNQNTPQILVLSCKG